MLFVGHNAVHPMNSEILGQVGQESNLHPAVLEKAALGPIRSGAAPLCRIFLCFHERTVPYSPVAFRRIAAFFAAAATPGAATGCDLQVVNLRLALSTT
jgi:hypothetical protein